MTTRRSSERSSFARASGTLTSSLSSALRAEPPHGSALATRADDAIHSEAISSNDKCTAVTLKR